ncbi:hypothetical protein NEPTK9_000692 [Candidatus Neptunochlamydia vexilliferae]|uniref:Uncharacterized protein n=1 Tax=Candidatus Neptunichlamydia vexilliferae TaxID=1651774 RepID=A0ABS0AYZ3_9BACT|nr:hypothetical protein [Candidatus Neptunochlamydia vexilliferae]
MQKKNRRFFPRVQIFDAPQPRSGLSKEKRCAHGEKARFCLCKEFFRVDFIGEKFKAPYAESPAVGS